MTHTEKLRKRAEELANERHTTEARCYPKWYPNLIEVALNETWYEARNEGRLEAFEEVLEKLGRMREEHVPSGYYFRVSWNDVVREVRSLIEGKKK